MGKRRGLARGGVFIFFFLWLGEGKKNQNSNSIPAQINVCSKASRGRLGQADLKGQRGAEPRGWGKESVAMMGVWVEKGCPGRKKMRAHYP